MFKSLIIAVAFSVAFASAASAQPRRVVIPQPNPIVEALPYIIVGALLGGAIGAALGAGVSGGALAVGTSHGMLVGATAGGVAGGGLALLAPRG